MEVVDPRFSNWNQIHAWLRQVEAIGTLNREASQSFGHA